MYVTIIWEVLRDQVSMVAENVLLPGTIYDNIRWGNEHASDEEVKGGAVWRRQMDL